MPKELPMENEPKGIDEENVVHFKVTTCLGYPWDRVRIKATLPDGGEWKEEELFKSGSKWSLNRAKKKLRKHHRIACIGTRTELL